MKPLKVRGKRLAKIVLARIRKEERPHGEKWVQDDWRCGTGCCFAGHVALAAGWEWVDERRDDSDWQSALMSPPANSGVASASHAEGVAADLLGVELGSTEEEMLFHADNGLDDIANAIETVWP